MSFVAKAANRNVTYGGPDDFVNAKSMKHMNEALLERVREGIALICELKKAVSELSAENDELKRQIEVWKAGLELLTELNEQRDRTETATTQTDPAGEAGGADGQVLETST
jgi:hypothetical protein